MAGKAKTVKTAQPLSAHVPLAAEVPAHVIEYVMSDGSVMVRGATGGGVSSFRLAVADDMTLMLVGDP
jgi:hypothetical protein